MNNYSKRLFSLLLTLVLLVTCLNGITPKVWAEETASVAAENIVAATEAPEIAEESPVEAAEPEEEQPAAEPTDPAEPDSSTAAEEPAAPEDDPVAEVKALLAQIDSLAEMQSYRVTVTREVFRNASGNYSSGNYANRTEQHIEAQNRYKTYVEDMFAKRAAAKAAYDALTDAQKAEIDADEVAAANLAKLTPYESLETCWFTHDRIIIAPTSQTAEQLKFPIPVTPTTDASDPYIYEFVRAYELSLHHAAYGYMNSFALVDTTTSGDTWMPDSFYEYGQSNYLLAYCCDSETNAHRGFHYKRINLEDADYYSAEDAAHIRTIVENSYPFTSMDEMKEFLLARGFDPEMTKNLTRSDLIAAVQMAIWTYSNAPNKEEFVYEGTCAPIEARDRRDYLLLPSLHDYRNEDWTWYLISPGDYYSSSGYRYTYYADIEERVNALTAFLCNLPGTVPEEDQIVISNIRLSRSSLTPNDDGTFEILLNVFLNHGAGTNDNVTIKVTTSAPDGGNSIRMPEEIVVDGRRVYRVRAQAKDGETITVTVSGTQDLPKGVYYYEVEGGTEVSQSLVGMASGKTRVFAEKSFTFNREADTGVRVYKTAKGSELPISDIEFNFYPVAPEDVESIGQVPTREEIDKYAVEENLAGTILTDDTGYGFLALPRGTYLVVEELNADKIRQTVAPFYVTIPNPVEVTDEDGAVTVVYEDVAEFHIENIPAGMVPAELQATKEFNDWGKADSFTFELAAVTAGAPMPGKTIAVATEEAPTAVFESMLFDQIGTYEYTITEIDDGVDGVTYDTAPHKVTVEVTLGEDGNLAAEVKYDGADSLTITNTFTPVTAVIEATKEFNDWGKAESFTFELASVTEGAPMPDETTAAATEAQPKAAFAELTFDKAGTYEYTVTEINDGVDGVTYDTEPHKVTVTVTKGEGNALAAEVSYDGADSLTITNTFTPVAAVIEVTKELTGREWQDEDAFTFVLEAVTEDAPLPETTSATATKAQPVASFGEIVFTKTGTYTYTVTEEKGDLPGVSYDTEQHEVVVKVTKDENNAMIAEVLYDGAKALTVINPYTQALAEILVTKQITGRTWKDDDSFTFHLAAVTANAPMPETTTVTATKGHETVSFGTMIFTEPGTYEYKVTEEAGKAPNMTYDTAEHKVVVTVTRDEETKELRTEVTYDGGAKLTVTNKYAPPPPPPETPDTGDSNQPGLWAILAAVALLGAFLGLLALRKLRRN